MDNGALEIGVAVVPESIADRVPVFAAEVVGFASESGRAIVSHENDVLTFSGLESADNAIAGFSQVMDTVAIAIEPLINPVFTSGAKGPSAHDSKVPLGKFEFAVADMGGTEEVELNLEPIFDGAIVGCAFASGFGGAIPSVVVAEDNSFGEV